MDDNLKQNNEQQVNQEVPNNKVKGSNMGVIALLIIIIIILAVLCVLLFTGKIGVKNSIIESNVQADNSLVEETNNSTDDNQSNTNYKMGDVVKLSKLKVENENQPTDITEWYVLEEKDGYTKLYSKCMWSGKDQLTEIGLSTINVYKRLKDAGYNVSEVRQLNESELELFNCTIDYSKLSDTIKKHDGNPLTNNLYNTIILSNDEVKCSNLPTFIYENTTSPYTDVQLFGYTLSLGTQIRLHIQNPNALVGFLHPVVILPTSEIG